MAEEVMIGMGALQKRLAAISGPHSGERIMRTVGLATVREAKLLVARKTGNLGRSIHVASVSETTTTVRAEAKYAAFVEHGTAPHVITPNARKALRFAASPAGRRLSGSPKKGAAVVFAKVVHHPGTKAEPYLLPGAQRAIRASGLSNIIVDEWNGAA